MKSLFIFTILLSVFSCKNDPTNIEKASSNIAEVDTMQTEEIESKYHYDKDWKRFKAAVLSEDIKGIASFASSDNIDSEALLQSLSEEDILKKLASTTYHDLTTEEQGEFTLLVFSTKTTKVDEEGNEYESGISLYFSQGELSLLLDYYISTK